MLSLFAVIATHAAVSEPMSTTVLESAVVARTEVTPEGIGAAPTQAPSDGWVHSVALYLLAAGLDGTVTAKGVEAEIDASFSDILEDLEMGAMVAYRGESERYALTLDTIYMGLGAQGDIGPSTAEVDVDELVVELDWCWRIDPMTDLFVGARYWGISTDLALSGPGPGASVNADEEWIDPLIGARHTLPLAEDWSLTLRGDIGGFGVGSDFSWQAVARVNWQMTQSSLLAFGYRAVAVDYEDGSGTDEFRYDVTTSGFLAGFAFTF
jgi:hypothetical protein